MKNSVGIGLAVNCDDELAAPTKQLIDAKVLNKEISIISTQGPWTEFICHPCQVYALDPDDTWPVSQDRCHLLVSDTEFFEDVQQFPVVITGQGQ